MKAASFVLALALLAPLANAQDRIQSMPNFERARSVPGKLREAVVSGRVSVTWSQDQKRAYFQQGKEWRQLDVTTGKITPLAEEPKDFYRAPEGRSGAAGGRGGAARGRQVEVEPSPDGKLRATYKDSNVWLSATDGTNLAQVTTEGSAATRVKYGSASWVYGEELNQNDAMWFSPDSRFLAFYRFDESKIPDFFLTRRNGAVQNELYTEAYVKAGGNNPVVDVEVYDVAAKTRTKIDVRSGGPFEDATVGHYVYQIRWSPDGKELLFNRTNRQQNILELCAADPATGKVRVVLREDWSATWTDNRPFVQFLADGKRFLWRTERNGFYNFELWDLSGKKLAQVTNHTTFEAGNVLRLDEASKTLSYTARSGGNPHRLQLHRVGLDGKGERRLTDPNYTHSATLSPDLKHAVVVSSNNSTPEFTSVIRMSDGKVVAKLAEGNLAEFKKLGGQTVEFFSFTAQDGKTALYGELHKPSNFDPNRRYPVLVSVYNGPESVPVDDRWKTPNGLTEWGFLVLEVESRGGDNRGKAFKDALYRKMGVVEIDDVAAGMREILKRPYVDAGRIGVYGTSYGGYTSIMCLLRYPDLFHAACAGSPVTDWKHYDSIYTERYNWTPQGNPEGYAAGSAMTYAKNKKGALLIAIGLVDDNVHPSNSYELINALRAARKSYELQVVPDGGHIGPDNDRMMEFFIERLILDPQTTRP